jgi:predicted transcriptional regulator
MSTIKERYVQKRFPYTFAQILQHIPPEGIDHTELACDLNVSVVQLQQVLKRMAQLGLVHAHCENRWDGVTVTEYTIWRIKS